MPKKAVRKFDSLTNQSPKAMRRKLYAGRIKPTKGLQEVSNPTSKAISHRIVRRKLQREMKKEIES